MNSDFTCKDCNCFARCLYVPDEDEPCCAFAEVPIKLSGRVWQEDKWYVVELPAFDVCTQGTSKDDALCMLNDALRFHFKEFTGPDFYPSKSYWVDKEQGTFVVQIPWSQKVLDFMVQRLCNKVSLIKN